MTVHVVVVPYMIPYSITSTILHVRGSTTGSTLSLERIYRVFWFLGVLELWACKRRRGESVYVAECLFHEKRLFAHVSPF